MTWKQFLTERVLKEQWHYTVGVRYSEHFGNLEKCSCGRVECDEENRSFDTEADMMALYRHIEKDGKWGKYIIYSYETFEKSNLCSVSEGEYIAYLFCLDGKGYKERCKMVSEFYGWEADHD